MADLNGFLSFYRTAMVEYDCKADEGNEFNVFYLIRDIYGITETKHSRFLAFLLNPNESHGQKDKYLNLFLDLLEIDYKSEKKRDWVVEAERNNADISIKCTYPDKISVVIENKCFDAVDQPNQLYRYWYDHIYNYFNRDEKHYFNPNKCRIIYLPKGNWKVYSKNSVEKTAESYPNIDENIIVSWTFYKEIKNWLGDCICKTESPRIKEFISDYKKYWEETNFKNELIIDKMQLEFKDEKQWEDFCELANHKEDLKSRWIAESEKKFEELAKKGWYYYKENNNDLRIYTNEKGSTCFVYEYTKGLSIWKGGIDLQQKSNYRDKLNQIVEGEFSFIELDFHGNHSYMMEYCNNGDDLVFKDEDNYAWNAGNTNLAERITSILEKHLTENVKELFNEIDND